MSRVLHLNGAPGVGKSTLARRWADAHPGTMLLDIDELRTWISGWRDDFVATGGVVRPVALAMIGAYAAQGRDVVVPQLIANPDELARFRDAAVDADFVEVVLRAPDAPERFAARDQSAGPWLSEVHRLVEAVGADHHADYRHRLETLAATWPGVVVVDTLTGDVDGSYRALVACVEARPRPRPGTRSP